MKLNAKLDRLGTETAFAVSAQAKAWANKGNKVYSFHLGDINLPTPSNIREATNRYMNDSKMDIVHRKAFPNCAWPWLMMWGLDGV